MMTLIEFHTNTKAFAEGEYFSISLEVSEGKGRPTEVEFGCYVHGHGWHKASTPEQALASLTDSLTKKVPEAMRVLDAVGPIPALEHTS